MSAATDGVVIVGHATIDDIRRDGGEPLTATLGGAAVYATVAAARVGASRVRLVTRVGEDYPIERLGRDHRVDLGAVRCMAERSIHNVAWYFADGSRRFDIEDWSTLERLTPTVEDLEGLVLQDSLVLLTPAPLDIQLALVKHLRARGCRVAVDTELHYLRSARDIELLGEVLACADLALPSIEHLQALCADHQRDALSYAPALRELGCDRVLVKQGAAGSTLLSCASGRHLLVPAVRDVPVVDPTGAGDSYNGGLIASLARGEDLVTAACWGTVTAACAVQSTGATNLSVPADASACFMQVRSGVRQPSLP